MICTLSTLTDQDLQDIKKLEESLNKPLLAFSCRNVNMAQMSVEELARIQALESKMGISLVAVEP
ncbi:MAG: hypothetical protein JEZ02_04530 [Desulfatibacillum sp.]|nr:hypothetical protein [Desulfatibacillum sp.]